MLWHCMGQSFYVIHHYVVASTEHEAISHFRESLSHADDLKDVIYNSMRVRPVTRVSGYDISVCPTEQKTSKKLVLCKLWVERADASHYVFVHEVSDNEENAEQSAIKRLSNELAPIGYEVSSANLARKVVKQVGSYFVVIN